MGEEPTPAPLMLLGEQPGDREDREGEPFVGPAGDIHHEALAEAGIDPEATYDGLVADLKVAAAALEKK